MAGSIGGLVNLEIYEVFEEYKLYLTDTQIILISICLRVTIVQSFRICVTTARRYPLLVEC